MKKILFLIAALSIAQVSTAQKAKKNTKNSPKTEEQKTNEAAAKESEEERRARIAAVESRMIGPMHNFLTQWSGPWREEMKIWSTPNSQPMVTMMNREGRIISEGRFLTSNIIGQMGNHPYEAYSILGFDNTKMKFTKVWHDNMSTSILVLEGTYDKEKEIIEFEGTTIDPISRQPVKVRQIMRLTDPNNQLLEVYMEEKDGKEVKTMEIRSMR